MDGFEDAPPGPAQDWADDGRPISEIILDLLAKDVEKRQSGRSADAQERGDDDGCGAQAPGEVPPPTG